MAYREQVHKGEFDLQTRFEEFGTLGRFEEKSRVRFNDSGEIRISESIAIDESPDTLEKHEKPKQIHNPDMTVRSFISGLDRWRFRYPSLNAELLREIDNKERSKAVNTFGLTANPVLPYDLQFLRENAPLPEAAFEQLSRAGMIVVRMTDDRLVREWSFRENGPPVPQVVRFYEPDKPEYWQESRIKYRETDGVLFPSTIHVFSSEFEDGREPSIRFEFSKPALNRPDQKDFFTPADIGLEPGVNVTVHELDGKISRGIWDGIKIADKESYYQRERAGVVQPGPIVVSERARLREHAKSNPDKVFALRLQQTKFSKDRYVSAWEKFVAEYCARHDLNPEQRAVADRILRDCLDQAEAYTTKNLNAFREFELELAAMQDSPSRYGPEDFERLGNERLKWEAPINAIFENQLKPRVEAIPTRQQKEAVDENKG
ncbi:MAG: hypothetical protein AB7N71_00165 [Phycisphaerae bacterium]